MSLPPLILASASPRRSTLLRQLGYEFEVAPASIREIHAEYLTAREMSLVNAHRKARTVAKLRPDGLVIAADTLVHFGSHVFGKPANFAEAADMIRELSGKTHRVVTGICLIHLRGHREVLQAETSDVRFRQLESGEIERYLRLVNPLDKAGAYALQEHGELIVEEVFGSFTNVVGLPVERLQAVLQGWT